MRYRRLITALTFIASLPIVAGCATSQTYELGTDPWSPGAVQVLIAGDSIGISGYTSASSGYHQFLGLVRLATPNTLEFLPAPKASKPAAADPGFTLPRLDVTSVDVVIPDKRKTQIALAVGVLAVGAAITHAP